MYSEISLIKDDKVEIELKQKQTYKKASRLEKLQLQHTGILHNEHGFSITYVRFK